MLSALLTAGPTILRMVGNLFGGKTQEVANTVAEVADKVQGLPDSERQKQMQAAIENLPPEARVELAKIANEAQKISAEREAHQLDAETARNQAAQETIRAEVNSGDEYVRRARPKIAIRSFNLTAAYILVFEAMRVIGKFAGVEVPGADVTIAGALISPCVWWVTMRTGDKIAVAWGGKGKT